MSWWERWGRAAARWAGFAFFVLGVIAAFAVWRRRGGGPVTTPTHRILTEMKAIQAAAEADKVVAQRGHDEAIKSVEEEHATAMARLDEAQKAEAARLTKDPGELARFLVRAAGRAGKALLLVLTLTLSAAASAAPRTGEVYCDPNVPGACAMAIVQGQPAPFSGQVLTTTLAIALGQKAEGCDQVVAIERRHATARTEAEMAFRVSLAKIERDAAVKEAVRLLDALKVAEEEAEEARSGFFRQPWLWALIGATVTAGAVGAGYRLLGG